MKAYVKPELFYERYELSQNIAACAWDYQTSGEYEGTYKLDTAFGYPDGVYLFDAAPCTDTNIEAYCYTNGELGKNQFNS